MYRTFDKVIMMNLIQSAVLLVILGFSEPLSTLSRSNFILDMSGSFGLLSIRGADRLRLLHSLASESFDDAVPGDSFSTCFLDASGKLLDYARCIVTTKDDVKLLVDSHKRAEELSMYLGKFIFPFDKVAVIDESLLSSVYLTVGSDISPDYIKRWMMSETIQDSSSNRKTVFLHDGTMIAPGNDIFAEIPEHNSQMQDGLQGYTIIKQSSESLSIPAPPVVDTGIVTTLNGTEAVEKWQEFRRVTGRFSVESDARAFNATPLELGLMHTLHFRKGCYSGNEVISKIVSTKALRRSFCGFLAAENGESEGLKVGDVLDFDGDSVGTITAAPFGRGRMALGFLKTKIFEGLPSGTESLKLTVSGNEGVSCLPFKLPFPRFNATQSSRAPPLEKLKSIGKTIMLPSADLDAIEESAEDIRKKLKLEQMQRKVAALQAQKKNRE